MTRTEQHVKDQRSVSPENESAVSGDGYNADTESGLRTSAPQRQEDEVSDSPNSLKLSQVVD